MEEEYVGGKFYKNIEVDDRVTPDLSECLYCYVTSSSRGPNTFKTGINYRIPLDSLSPGFKQCPACKIIYILTDPLVSWQK